MFYSRGGAIRLCWAAVDQAFRSSSSSSGSLHVRVNVNRPRGVTWALLPNICTFQCPRGFCAAAAIELRAPREEAQGTRREKVVSSAVQKWDYSSSSLSPPAWISDRGGHFLFDRGVDLTGRDQCSGQSLLPAANRCRSRRVKTVSTSVAALFSTGGGTTLSCCYSPRCSNNNNTTTTMQTRASSTAAATQRREAADAGETDNKGEEQKIKEPSPPAPPSTSSSSPKAPGEPEAEQEPQQDKPNKTQQLQKVFKEYGAVGVSFHITMSLMSLGMFYLLVSSGIDMAAVLCKLGFSEAFVESKMAAGTSTFVLAYAVHKLFAPARISITLVSVPLIVRYLRKTGLFKPPTTTP